MHCKIAGAVAHEGAGRNDEGLGDASRVDRRAGEEAPDELLASGHLDDDLAAHRIAEADHRLDAGARLTAIAGEMATAPMMTTRPSSASGVKASPIGHECSVGLMEARQHPLYLMGLRQNSGSPSFTCPR